MGMFVGLLKCAASCTPTLTYVQHCNLTQVARNQSGRLARGISDQIAGDVDRSTHASGQASKPFSYLLFSKLLEPQAE